MVQVKLSVVFILAAAAIAPVVAQPVEKSVQNNVGGLTRTQPQPTADILNPQSVFEYMFNDHLLTYDVMYIHTQPIHFLSRCSITFNDNL